MTTKEQTGRVSEAAGGGNGKYWILGMFALIILLLGFPAGAAKNYTPLAPPSFVYPLMAPRLSSAYGERIHPIRRFSHNHQGIDLAAPPGSPIRAIAGGTVVFADPYQGYGNLVVVRHNLRMTSHYAHCQRIAVNPGQQVQAGQIIAYVGSTGTSTGPHLHFEVRVNGKPVNPERFIPGLASEADG